MSSYTPDPTWVKGLVEQGPEKDNKTNPDVPPSTLAPAGHVPGDEHTPEGKANPGPGVGTSATPTPDAPATGKNDQEDIPPYVGFVLDAFEDVVRAGDGWRARCPHPKHGDDG